jgi:hypothetical protein
VTPDEDAVPRLGNAEDSRGLQRLAQGEMCRRLHGEQDTFSQRAYASRKPVSQLQEAEMARRSIRE